MSRYKVQVRETVVLTYEVTVEAEGSAQAYRLAEDPDNWTENERPQIVDPADGLTAAEEVETLDYSAMEAEREESE